MKLLINSYKYLFNSVSLFFLCRKRKNVKKDSDFITLFNLIVNKKNATFNKRKLK